MSNETVGTISVFVLTLCLFLLRHLVLTRSSNSNKRHGADAG